MKTIYLVSCVKTKRDGQCQAKELYTSTWFTAARSYVESLGARWYILSAKYGLLNPQEVVAQYEQTLNTMKAEERKAWADVVLAKLEPLLESGDRVIFLAGKHYREFLEARLRSCGVLIDAPINALRQGQQVQWLQGKARGSP